MDLRRAARRVPREDEPVSRVRLRTGCDLLVVNVSDRGVLVEGVRLLPGTHLDLHVVTPEGRVLIRSRVLRAYVQTLRADAMSYRAALAFDRPIDTSHIGYRIPGNGHPVRIEPGTRYPASSDIEGNLKRESLSA